MGRKYRENWQARMWKWEEEEGVLRGTLTHKDDMTAHVADPILVLAPDRGEWLIMLQLWPSNGIKDDDTLPLLYEILKCSSLA